MQWSKLKQRIENGFADCAKGRVEVWTTRYRRSHDEEGEGWITIDKNRVHSMATLSYFAEFHEQATALRQSWACPDFRNDATWDTYVLAGDVAKAHLAEQGVIPLWDFNSALLDYLNMSMDDVLSADRMIIRALGMFDRRLGKRRLTNLDLTQDVELVQTFHGVRCAFEGLRLPRSVQTGP